jgi:hypothetical protein
MLIPAILDGRWIVEVAHIILKMDQPNIISAQNRHNRIELVEMKTLQKKPEDISCKEIYIFINGRHLEWRAGLSRSILKGDNLSQI